MKLSGVNRGGKNYQIGRIGFSGSIKMIEAIGSAWKDGINLEGGLKVVKAISKKSYGPISLSVSGFNSSTYRRMSAL
jgi:hypothetical protein